MEEKLSSYCKYFQHIGAFKPLDAPDKTNVNLGIMCQIKLKFVCKLAS